MNMIYNFFQNEAFFGYFIYDTKCHWIDYENTDQR